MIKKIPKTRTKKNEYDYLNSNPWTFDGKIVDDEDVIGYEAFVYIITRKSDLRRYIGVKKLVSVRKQPGKSRRQRSASDWKRYWGSSESLKEMIKEDGIENYTREILSFHLTFSQARYFEVYYQFKFDVLHNTNFINDNINGKWFKKNILKYKPFFCKRLTEIQSQFSKYDENKQNSGDSFCISSTISTNLGMIESFQQRQNKTE